MRRGKLGMIAAALLLLSNSSWSQLPASHEGNGKQPNQTEASDNRGPVRADQEGANTAPIVVKIVTAFEIKPESVPNFDAHGKDTTQKLWELPGIWLHPDWAMNVLTMCLVLVGVIQIFVFGLQARRLKKTINTMEATERRQLRAYVGIEKLSFEYPSLEDPCFDPSEVEKEHHIYRDFVVAIVKNFGRTPAYDVTVFTHISSTDFGKRLPSRYLLDKPADLISNDDTRTILARFILNEGQSEISKSRIKSADVPNIRKAEEKIYSIYVWGGIYYKDVYNRPWRTTFCYVWEPWHSTGERFVAYEHYNGEDQAELLLPEAEPDIPYKVITVPLDGSYQPSQESDDAAQNSLSGNARP